MNIYLAKLADQAERYDDMAEYMTAVCGFGEGLSSQERNLLAVAYKNATGSRRSSLRMISAIEEKEVSSGNSALAAAAREYKAVVEQELLQICNKILRLLDEILIPGSRKGETRVFYGKMKGDYYRYIAEFASSAAKSGAIQRAHDAYRSTMDIAEAQLPVTHPTRLGLVLNFSVFNYEVLNDPDEGVRIAKEAFDDAVAHLDNIPEDTYKDSTLIIQLLRDNVIQWTSDAGEGLDY